MRELKLIVDANILVSAYSTSGRIQERWRVGIGPHQLFISPEIFAEVERTLREAEFHLSPTQIRESLKDILQRCVLVRPKTRFEGEIPDENDRHLANLALEIQADQILSGDASLRKEDKIAGIPVVKFAELVAMNGRSGH